MTNQESGKLGALKRWAHKFDPSVTDTKERFWLRVSIGNPDQCWPWKGGPMTKGYPIVKIYGVRHNAHHAAWMFTNDEIKSGKIVCHTCDNRICCNPNHLFLGSNLENTHDALRKGRMARGERSGPSKLTEQEVKDIRAIYETGTIGHRGLAKQFNVCKSTITFVLNRLTWTHI